MMSPSGFAQLVHGVLQPLCRVSCGGCAGGGLSLLFLPRPRGIDNTVFNVSNGLLQDIDHGIGGWQLVLVLLTNLLKTIRLQQLNSDAIVSVRPEGAAMCNLGASTLFNTPRIASFRCCIAAENCWLPV